MKYIFIIFFSFCGLFFNNGLKAAEKINIKFEEMEIPLTIDQLSKLEKFEDDSTELIAVSYTHLTLPTMAIV